MDTEKKSNLAKGVNSFDSTIGNNLITFFNKNVTPYPTDIGGPSFELVPVSKQKDIMINVARMHGQQEYNRIMELVSVLQKQAASIKRRLEITDLVHAAKYEFQTYHGQVYWLCYDHRVKLSKLVLIGPDEWNTGCPIEYEYICRVKWLGDYTWLEVDDQGNPVE
jgi:hypothetical protein